MTKTAIANPPGRRIIHRPTIIWLRHHHTSRLETATMTGPCPVNVTPYIYSVPVQSTQSIHTDRMFGGAACPISIRSVQSGHFVLTSITTLASRRQHDGTSSHRANPQHPLVLLQSTVDSQRQDVWESAACFVSENPALLTVSFFTIQNSHNLFLQPQP